MKVRNGFVSNSSSSSFVIKKDNLTANQAYMIKNHIEVAKHNGFDEFADIGDEWSIRENEKEIYASTTMDNFDLMGFCLRVAYVDPNDIIWDD